MYTLLKMEVILPCGPLLQGHVMGQSGVPQKPTTPRFHQKAEAPIVSSSSTLCLATWRIVFNLTLGHLTDHGRPAVRAWPCGRADGWVSLLYDLEKLKQFTI